MERKLQTWLDDFFHKPQYPISSYPKFYHSHSNKERALWAFQTLWALFGGEVPIMPKVPILLFSHLLQEKGHQKFPNLVHIPQAQQDDIRIHSILLKSS